MKQSGNLVAPTSTITQARLMLFQPTQRPKYREGEWLETSHGRCRVFGRLGQRHADLLEAILYCAEDSRAIIDGGIELLVDPARIRRTLSDSQYSFAQMEKLLIELCAAVINIKKPQFDVPLIGTLVDHREPALKTRRDPLTGGFRNLWKVRLGKVLVELLERDLALYYNPAPIARLQHGIAQAVARHILTHQNEPAGGWYMDTVILAVAGQLSGKSLRDARFRLREDADRLEQIGVVIEGGRVRRVVSNRRAPAR